MEQFAKIGKVDLRAMCKCAGISYSKLTNDGMRQALALWVAQHIEEIPERGLCEYCPHCGIHLDNGHAHFADITDVNPKEAAKMKHEWTCLGCGGEWGARLRQPIPTEASGKGLQIEKDREERNGIKRPSVGGKCRAIWDWLDTVNGPTAKQVRAHASAVGWNENNAVIEFYQWRRFNGITGRAK